jgi:hypothetical protein
VSSSDQPKDSSRDGDGDAANDNANDAANDNPQETVIAEATVTVHRSPRYRNFMLLGAIVGALLAFVFTLAFPQNEEYDRLQIFGFLLLGGISVGAGLGAVVALVIDRIIGRSHRTVVADRLGATEPRAAEPGSGTPNDDFQTFNEK